MLKPFAMDATLAPICNDLPPSLERKRQETPYDSVLEKLLNVNALDDQYKGSCHHHHNLVPPKQTEVPIAWSIFRVNSSA